MRQLIHYCDKPFTPLPENITVDLQQLGFDSCCWQRFWHPTDSNRLYVIDGVNGQQAALFEWSIEAGSPQGVF